MHRVSSILVPSEVIKEDVDNSLIKFLFFISTNLTTVGVRHFDQNYHTSLRVGSFYRITPSEYVVALCSSVSHIFVVPCTHS
jgi:hypothetical protein